MAISYPVRSEGRAAFRRILEMAAQFNSFTGALAHLYGYTHPSEFEQALEAFHKSIAATVNDHDARLDQLETLLAPRARIGELALDVAFHLLRTDETGRGLLVDFTDVRSAFEGVSKEILEEAIAELERLGYVTTTSALSHPIRTIHPADDLYLAFDLAATGNDTRADAIQIAGLWLEHDELRSVRRLEEHLGWPLRRLNPAVGALLRIFPPGRRSGEVQPTYKVMSVLVTQDERFRLRRMTQTGSVDLS
jgi:hypothetical protein